MAEQGGTRIGLPYRKLGEHPLLEGLVAKLGLGEELTDVGWGYRPSGRAAMKAAGDSGSLLLLEDAFVRSLKPGEAPVYGLVADTRGMYFDASDGCDLIDALESGSPTGWMNDGPMDRRATLELMERYRRSRASKYNWYGGDFSVDVTGFEPGVLVVDQTRGDMSISCGGVAEGGFERMVRDALDEHPGETVYLRAHPDHRYRGKHSCFPDWVFTEQRARILPPDLSPAACFEFCNEVYVATSLMGMEALLHDRVVKSYGWNFYAGWGLTEDRCESEVAKRSRTLELADLFETAFLRYGHYFDPDSGEVCELGRILEHVELQRRVWSDSAGERVTVGWTPWQRKLAADFLHAPATELKHVASLAEVELGDKKTGRVMFWGGKEAVEEPSAPVVRVEDGFIRSAGLGAAFHRPLSWVFDDEGIYFDGRSPSRLESLLERGGFSGQELCDARGLIEFLRKNRVTKYNLAACPVELDAEQVGGRKVILVPGQVERDASIRYGSPELKTNLELLHRVREVEPEAYLVFKVHPDLVAGARHGSVLPEGYAEACDLAVMEGNILDWMTLCDEVHTMTSTVGFEALIREMPVVTHGLPFYAGWGLTKDRLEMPRRTRKLTLEELVCGALIKYPRYLNPLTGEFTTAIKVAELLSSDEVTADKRGWHMKAVSKLKKLWVESVR